LANFDYTLAQSALVPWKVDENDICARSKNGTLLEFPIYSENRWIGSFLTPQRIYRACVSRLHRFYDAGKSRSANDAVATSSRRNYAQALSLLTSRHAWKADFNQCSGRQLIRALERAETQYKHASIDLPFVLIGHSKLFTRFNKWSLGPFLPFVADNPHRFGFARFSDFDLHNLRALDMASQSHIAGL
jgi:hypothetical protein